MNKSEIISNLNTVHLAFWDTAIQIPNTTISINGKWSVSQNVEHINITLSKVNDFLLLPKSSIESNFGLSNRESINYKSFVKIYQIALKNGVKATEAYIPDSNTPCPELITEGKKTLSDLISNIQNWEESDLDLYNCPHPALGKITIKEVLYFTIYHAQHHHNSIKKK